MKLLPEIGSHIIASHERLINDTLMTLVSRPEVSYLGAARDELVLTLEEIADMRFGDPPYPRPAGFYSSPLYWHTFGPDPEGNAAYRLGRLRQRFHNWIDRDPDKVAFALRMFHMKFGEGCAAATKDHPMGRLEIMHLIEVFTISLRS